MPARTRTWTTPGGAEGNAGLRSEPSAPLALPGVSEPTRGLCEGEAAAGCSETLCPGVWPSSPRRTTERGASPACHGRLRFQNRCRGSPRGAACKWSCSTGNGPAVRAIPRTFRRARLPPGGRWWTCRVSEDARPPAHRGRPGLTLFPPRTARCRPRTSSGAFLRGCAFARPK